MSKSLENGLQVRIAQATAPWEGQCAPRGDSISKGSDIGSRVPFFLQQAASENAEIAIVTGQRPVTAQILRKRAVPWFSTTYRLVSNIQGTTSAQYLRQGHYQLPLRQPNMERNVLNNKVLENHMRFMTVGTRFVNSIVGQLNLLIL